MHTAEEPCAKRRRLNGSNECRSRTLESCRTSWDQSQLPYRFWAQVRRWILDKRAAARCRRVCREWNTLFACRVHERDRRLRFDEPSHTYFIDGQRDRQLISVTTVLHSMFPHFDADKAILAMRNGRKWGPANPYYKMTDDEIKQAWETNRVQAAALGTRMHAHLEALFNARIAGAYWFDEFGIGEDLLRHDHLRAFLADHEWLEPVRMEWGLWDRDLHVAGTIDALFRVRNPKLVAKAVIESMPAVSPDVANIIVGYGVVERPKSWENEMLAAETRSSSSPHAAREPEEEIEELVMLDWKRSKRIDYDNPFQSGLPGTPVESFADCNYEHYRLQLNFYKYMIEKHYSARVIEMALVVFHVDQPNYVKIPVDDLQDVIREICEYRRQQLAGFQPWRRALQFHSCKD